MIEALQRFISLSQLLLLYFLFNAATFYSCNLSRIKKKKKDEFKNFLHGSKTLVFTKNYYDFFLCVCIVYFSSYMSTHILLNAFFYIKIDVYLGDTKMRHMTFDQKVRDREVVIKVGVQSLHIIMWPAYEEMLFLYHSLIIKIL